MTLPASGMLGCASINVEMGNSPTSQASLHAMSLVAGFPTPDKISDFYGWSASSFNDIYFCDQIGTGNGESYTFRSDSFGNWTNVGGVNFPTWLEYGMEMRSMAQSYDGNYIFCGDLSTYSGGYNWIVRSDDGGSTWDLVKSETALLRRFFAISCSSSGQYVLAANQDEVFWSDDFGDSWSSPAADSTWNCCWVSESGQYAACGRTSTTTLWTENYGSSWDTTTVPTLSSAGVRQMIHAKDTSVLVFIGWYTSQIAVTYDYFNSYTLSGTLTSRFSGGCISNDGKYILVPPSDGYSSPTSTLNVSSDYGQNWSSISSGVSAQLWSHSAMSGDGEYMLAIDGLSTDANCVYSSNYGASFSTISGITGAGRDCNVSETGQYAFIATAAGSYQSDDYMATWAKIWTDTSVGRGLRFVASEYPVYP